MDILHIIGKVLLAITSVLTFLVAGNIYEEVPHRVFIILVFFGSIVLSLSELI